METELVSALSTLSTMVENAVEHTREVFKEAKDFEHFLAYSDDINHGTQKLATTIYSYADCMEKVGVKTKAELEELWSKNIEKPGVKDAVEKLQLAEKHLKELVDEIAAKLNPQEDKATVNEPAKVGEVLPKDYKVMEIPSGQQITLEESLKGSKYTLFVLLRLFG